GGALGAPGWLPAPLVEEASRAAVALLDLEAGPAGGLAEAGTGAGAGAGAGAGSADPWPVAAASREFPSGPVPFTASSYGSPAAGGFGPADASYGAGPYGSPTESAAGSGPGAVPQPRTAPGDPAAGHRVSVSAAGRRFSCTLVLAAAAVLAVLSGGLYGMGLLPGQGDGDRNLADGAARPSASASAPAPAGSAGPGATPPKGTRADVPKELTGTWKGTVTTARLGVATEFEITIRSGRVGEVVGRDKSVLDVLGTDCGGDWKLTSATDRSLVLDTSGNTNPAPGICSGGSADERFTLNENGTLHYKSGDGPAGNPEGDLTRSP
ncbi:serine/threonine protein kinase, partial [Streptomyces goshikiensis]